MSPSSHVFSIHGSMVCFRLNVLPPLASSQGFFFVFLRRCCCRWLLLLQPGKCATSRPRDEDGHLQVRQISVEHNARLGWLCRCACWFWLHGSCTFKKRIARIMPRRFAWCRTASPPWAYRPRACNTVQAVAGFRTQAMSVAWAFMPHFSSAGTLLVQQLGRTQHTSFYLSRLFCAPYQK
jgi:hypothetical protein